MPALPNRALHAARVQAVGRARTGGDAGLRRQCGTQSCRVRMAAAGSVVPAVCLAVVRVSSGKSSAARGRGRTAKTSPATSTSSAYALAYMKTDAESRAPRLLSTLKPPPKPPCRSGRMKSSSGFARRSGTGRLASSAGGLPDSPCSRCSQSCAGPGSMRRGQPRRS